MRSYHPLAALIATLTGLLVASGEAHPSGRWQWPVDGRVTERFRTSGNPFAAGQHRGVDIAARPGTPVRAACAGRVTFAGRLPQGRSGVTIACGDLAATHLGLGGTTARRGETVRAGETIGRAAGGHMQLGAREREDRFGYLDPLRLLEQDPPPLGAAPARREPRERPRGARPSAAPRAGRGYAVAPRSESVDAVAPARTPAVSPLAFAGLAVLLAALPGGGLVAGRRRRARSAAARAAATAR
jgi:hypothetical protein